MPAGGRHCPWGYTASWERAGNQGLPTSSLITLPGLPRSFTCDFILFNEKKNIILNAMLFFYFPWKKNKYMNEWEFTQVEEMTSTSQKRGSTSIGFPAANSTGESKVLTMLQMILQPSVFSCVFDQHDIFILSGSEWNNVSNSLFFKKKNIYIYQFVTIQTAERLLRGVVRPSLWIFQRCDTLS